MPQNNTRSLVHTAAQILLIAFCLCVGLALYTSAPQAQAAPAAPAPVVCGTDYECAAVELLTALNSGTRVYEDLSFQGASALYSAKNDLLADRFWAAHQGQDWTVAKKDLEDWLDGQIGPC